MKEESIDEQLRGMEWREVRKLTNGLTVRLQQGGYKVMNGDGGILTRHEVCLGGMLQCARTQQKIKKFNEICIDEEI